MDSYDDRRTTLDPGLTLLALRGRRDPDARFPFLERILRGRRWWLLGAGILVTGFAVWRGSTRNRQGSGTIPPPDPR